MNSLSSILKIPAAKRELKGRFFYKKSVKNLSWFKTGGILEYLYIPKNENDLTILLESLSPDIDLNIFGKFSNVLIRDGGLSGLSILIPSDFKKITQIDNYTVNVGSGSLDKYIAKKSIDYEIGGLEFLIGIPGTIGGGVIMNAGCYGSEFKDIILDVDLISRDGKKIKKKLNDINFSYRNSQISKNFIITSVTIKGYKKDKEKIEKKIKAIKKKRISSQPQGFPTGGSTFKNTKNYKAWELIERSGLSGLQYGDAMISDVHNNFLINLGNAKASDFENLGNIILNRVKKEFGITMNWEIQILGSDDTN